jgi:hypothetical protein
MSLRFLPTPIYTILIFILVIGAFYYAFKYYKEEKLVGIGIVFFAISGIFVLLTRVLEEYSEALTHYLPVLVVIAIVLLVIGFILIISGRWKETMEDPIRKKVLITCFVLMGFVVLGFLIIWIIFS